MKNKDSHGVEQRHDTIKSHLIAEHRHDPYKASGKLAEPSACPQCGAVFHGGRWQWTDTPPQGAKPHLCPACHRTNDNFPAGELTLSGAFVTKHASEIVGLIRNIETAEKKDHPMQRVMQIAASPTGTIVTTTDIHLPRRIGHALVDAYKGTLDTHYDESGYFVRMHWRREA